MRGSEIRETFRLSPGEIDRFSDWLEERLSDMKTDRRDRMKIRLLTEEIFLRMRERFGEEAAADVCIERRFARWQLRIETEQEPFNPLSETGNTLGDWNSSLLTAVELTPRYTYTWGKNVFRLALPGKKMNPVLMIGIAILAGLAVGLAGKFLLPDSFRLLATEAFFSPLYEIWLRILNALSGPVIFLMVVTTVLNTKGITRQGGNKSYVLARYFLFSILASCFALFCVYPFFLKYIGQFRLSRQILGEMLRSFNFFPDHLFEPFTSSNTPQLIFVALVLGSAMLAAGDRVAELRELTRQVNMIGLQLAKWVSLLVPFFTGAFLALEIWQGQTDVLAQMWQPLALSLILTAALLLAAVLCSSARLRLSPLSALGKLWGPFRLALKTGSLDASFDEAERCCVRRLGIDPSYAKISLPQGLVLYMPVNIVGVIVFALYAAQAYRLSLEPARVLAATVFVVVLFVATPPVPGANLLAFTVLFAWLGIPSAALIDAMIFDIVFGIVAAAGNLMMLQLETCLQAKRFGLLDLSKLREK